MADEKQGRVSSLVQTKMKMAELLCEKTIAYAFTCGRQDIFS